MLDQQEIMHPDQVVTDDLKQVFMLNGVRFVPAEHFLKIKGEGGTKEYLPYAARLAWFRAVCPKGVIKTEIVEHDKENGYILIKAHVDDGSGGLAQAYGSCTRQSFPRGYIEKAETKAKNRALADLGYGTLFAQELMEDDQDGEVSDTPQPIKNARSNGGVAPAQKPAQPARPAPVPPQASTPAQTETKEPTPLNKIPVKSAIKKDVENGGYAAPGGGVLKWVDFVDLAFSRQLNAKQFTRDQILNTEWNPKYCEHAAAFLATLKKAA